ncbi:hypothetical protein [Argonema antarcticum]|uniref:hypothetical protein n=1 Tax=Argonema antarcticum TaxID=2942763 RepID=UPI0020134D31|nr:hypothetical protein [Argonema antarcticum]MCL1471038.1 hypothetical protein [Argonema antarcticum A004/B2]
MESIRNQVVAVNNKVDALYQMVEQLTSQISEVVSETRRTTGSSTDSSAWKLSDARYPYKGSRMDSAMAHKDVLADNSYVDTGSHNREKELAPEIQIQRLTAQLTAAYNRIAALEEQLLAQRVH